MKLQQKLITMKCSTLVKSLFFLHLQISLFGCNTACAASILCLSKFGHKIGVLKSPAFSQGKELQVTRFQIMCFWLQVLAKKKGACSHYNEKFGLKI